MDKSTREVQTKRLAELVNLIDRIDNVFTFKVDTGILDIEEKLILAGQRKDLKYLVVSSSLYGYETIRFIYPDKEVTATPSERKTKDFEDMCIVAGNVVKYFI